jgi:hypothetical protein
MYRKQAVRIAKENGIKKDEDDPVFHESVMKARACTPSQDALITLSNMTGVYPSKSVIAV